MPSLIGNMMATYLHPMQKFACAVQVRIRRNGIPGPLITAIVADLEETSRESMPNTTLVAGARNYEIDVADYKVNSEVVDPEQGDQILEAIGGRNCVFGLMRQGNMPAFEKVDNDGVKWLVRTKRTSDG